MYPVLLLRTPRVSQETCPAEPLSEAASPAFPFLPRDGEREGKRGRPQSTGHRSQDPEQRRAGARPSNPRRAWRGAASPSNPSGTHCANLTRVLERFGDETEARNGTQAGGPFALRGWGWRNPSPELSRLPAVAAPTPEEQRAPPKTRSRRLGRGRAPLGRFVAAPRRGGRASGRKSPVGRSARQRTAAAGGRRCPWSRSPGRYSPEEGRRGA